MRLEARSDRAAQRAHSPPGMTFLLPDPPAFFMLGLAPEAAFAAKLHPDELLDRAIRDVAQILYCALTWLRCGEEMAPPSAVEFQPRLTRNYLVQPPVLWAMTARPHLTWVVIFGINLCAQYELRFQVPHANKKCIHRAAGALIEMRKGHPLNEDNFHEKRMEPGDWVAFISHPDRFLKAEEIDYAISSIARSRAPQGCAFGVFCCALRAYPALIVREAPLELGLKGAGDYVASYQLYLAWRNLCRQPLIRV